MASIGHLAVGAAAARMTSGLARPSWRSMLSWSALSMLPDADVITLALGVPYGHPFGHRGFSHSLLFAAAVGGIAGLVAPRLGLPRRHAWLLATAVVASHPLFDTLTDGGLGCALFWPFDVTRYFAPWRPIPVSPLGLEYLSPYGAFVASTELVLFSPLLFFALRRGAPTAALQRGRRSVIIAAWAALVWLIGSSDPQRQSVVSFLLRADTEYASGFSDSHFAAVSAGMTEADVRRLLGVPLEEWWEYDSTANDCRVLHLVNAVVATWRDFEHCTPGGVQPGMPSLDLVRHLGPPVGAIWRYSRSRDGGWFRAHQVFFYRGTVEEKLKRFVPGEP